jgi:hypothetical protein
MLASPGTAVRPERLRALAGVTILASAGLLAARSPVGGFGLLLALAVLLVASRPDFVVGATFAATLSTVAWDVQVATVAGHTFDTRLLLTFGVAALVGVALALQRPRLRRLELLVCAFAGWIVVVGLLRSDSLATWAPPAARWTAYAGIFLLARACLTRDRDLRVLAAAVALSFCIPAGLGVIQLVAGEASTINGAVRATAPGGRGPIALAFAGQMVILLGYALAERRGSARPGWLASVALGAAGLVATATRLTTITALAALAGVQALRRQWRVLAVVPLAFVLVLLVRPDLRERYTGTGAEQIEQTEDRPPPASGSSDAAKRIQDPDASSRTRAAIWRSVLHEWEGQPVIGMGPGMTAPTFEVVSGRPRVAPHNDFIGVLAELGVVGLALFVAFQAAVIRALWLAVRAVRTTAVEVLATAVLATFVAVNVPGALNNAMYHFDVQLALWALAGSVLGIHSRIAEKLVGDR